MTDHLISNAVWDDDGIPKNLHAAAADAREWLVWMQGLAKHLQINLEADKLELCIEALETHLLADEPAAKLGKGGGG